MMDANETRWKSHADFSLVLIELYKSAVSILATHGNGMASRLYSGTLLGLDVCIQAEEILATVFINREISTRKVGR